MEEMFGDQNPFSDFFTTFFGGGFGEREAAARGGGARGGRSRRGQGATSSTRSNCRSRMRITAACAGCRSNMTAMRAPVDVRIPPGVGDGSRVRISGEGESGSGGAASGDLYLRVRLALHPLFERKGRDLYVKAPLPVTTAVLGGEVEVPTIAGKPVRLKIPALTQNGQVFRLKGYGMPAVGKSDDKGDAYARVEIQLPSQLTPEERTHYEAIAEVERGRREET